MKSFFKLYCKFNLPTVHPHKSKVLFMKISKWSSHEIRIWVGSGALQPMDITHCFAFLAEARYPEASLLVSMLFIYFKHKLFLIFPWHETWSLDISDRLLRLRKSEWMLQRIWSRIVPSIFPFEKATKLEMCCQLPW